MAVVALVVAGLASAPAGASAAGTRARAYLAPRHGLKRLEADVLAVSTPGRLRYRHYLTPRQYRARYEPTKARVRAVERRLRRRGMRVVGVERHRRWVAARVAGARAGAAALERPIPGVLGIAGLDGRRHVVRPEATLPPPPSDEGTPFRPVGPCSRSFGRRSARFRADGRTPLPAFRGRHLSYVPCGYVPRQLRSAYLGRRPPTGRGVTVAVVDPFASRTIRRDVDTYSRRHGEPPFAAGQFSQRLPEHFDLTGPSSCGTVEGWLIEQTLDIEAVHAMAPRARIRYYGAPRCDDPVDPGTIVALDRIVDENRASVVTNSYGDPESLFTAATRAGYEQAFLQAAMQGISVFFSSGDIGLPLYPSTDPWDAAVGGTSAAIGAHGRLLFQTGWATELWSESGDGSTWIRGGPIGSAGGGASALYARPSWQDGVVPRRGFGRRAVPDVAHLADGSTGLRVGITQRFAGGPRYGELRIGGTSLASPLMAAEQALANEHLGRSGFVNPTIYAQARRHARTFSDVTRAHDGAAVVRPRGTDSLTYGLSVFGESPGYAGKRLRTRRGWDPLTGIGVPTPRYLSRR